MKLLTAAALVLHLPVALSKSVITSDLHELETDVLDLEKDAMQAKVNKAGVGCLFDKVESDPHSVEQLCASAAKGDGDQLDDRGNLIKYTIQEDLVSLKIWKGLIRDCVESKEESALEAVIKAISQGDQCPCTEESCKGKKGDECCDNLGIERFGVDKWAYKNCEITDNFDPTQNGICGMGLGKDGFVNTNEKSAFRICEGGNVPGSVEPLEGLAALQKLVLEPKPGPKKHRQPYCEKLFEASSHKAYNVFKMLDNIVCQGAACKDAEAWYREFMGSPMVSAGKKGRSGALRMGKGVEIDPASAMGEYLASKGKSFDSSGAREACQGRKTEGSYYMAGNSPYAGVTQDLSDKCFPDEALIVAADVGRVFKTDHPAGKKQHLPGNNVAYAMFNNCRAPFLGGVSGTIAQFLRVVAGSFSSIQEMTHKHIMAVIAMTQLGGHHTLVELIIAAQSFVKFNNIESNLIDVTVPFDEYAETAKTDASHKTAKTSCIQMGLLDMYNPDGSILLQKTTKSPEEYLAMMKQFASLVDDDEDFN
jgi:hypothetical protein